jgi:hypothetical protein
MTTKEISYKRRLMSLRGRSAALAISLIKSEIRDENCVMKFWKNYGVMTLESVLSMIVSENIFPRIAKGRGSKPEPDIFPAKPVDTCFGHQLSVVHPKNGKFWEADSGLPRDFAALVGGTKHRKPESLPSPEIYRIRAYTPYHRKKRGETQA